jgi:transcriptional regulator with XRE-family HTH domain
MRDSIRPLKDNYILMKQPQLGQRIQEWRKAKGMTQEELVERCNINVRTIQRIEAGEVTPRPFTVKAIFEALQINEDAVAQEGEIATSPQFIKQFRTSFIAGIIYLVLAVMETLVDVSIMAGDISPSDEWQLAYPVLKVAVLITFVIFTFGIFRLGQQYRQLFIQVMSGLLILFTAGFIIEDIVTFWMEISNVKMLVFRSVMMGALYVLFSTSLLLISISRGTLYLIAGAAGLITGISFLTVVMAVPGLILLTVFEILLIALLYKAYQQAGPPHGVLA